MNNAFVIIRYTLSTSMYRNVYAKGSDEVTAKERIVAALAQRSGAICDDCLTGPAQLSARQVAHATCTALAKESVIHRASGRCAICGKTKIVNQLVANHPPVTAAAPLPRPDSGRLWYWEGNIQNCLARWLRQQGYIIRQEANTATREAGTDIIAERASGQELWVSVKGYPERSTHVQARHWFAGALFDLVLYRNERTDVALAIALPDGFATYLNLAIRTLWLRNAMPFSIYWIAESGDVRVE